MNYSNLRPKYQKYLLAFALVLSSLAISIRSSEGEVKLVLHQYPVLIFLLVVVSSILVAFYFRLKRSEISTLRDQIRDLSGSHDTSSDLLEELTERQREVYDLIISGKTNKEIMSELFIEQSTLKSHINQIYRKIQITSRRELKLKSKR